MAKVKKRSAVTGIRNARGKKAAIAKRSRTVKAAAEARHRSAKKPSGPVIRMAVRALDPRTRCGAATTVQLLFRVNETVDGRVKAHLVFFDRHGWYCEHGRTCPAVVHARKHGGRSARAS